MIGNLKEWMAALWILLQSQKMADRMSHMLPSMMLTLTGLLLINQYYPIDSPLWIIFVICVINYILLGAIDSYRRNIALYVIGIAFVILLIMTSWYFNISYIEILKDGYNWARSYTGEDILLTTMDTVLFHKGYSMLSMLVCSLLLMPITYIVHKNSYVQYIISILAFILLLYMAITGVELSKITLFCILLYILPNIVAKISKYLIPIFILMIGISIYIPSKEVPYEWNIVKAVLTKAEDMAYYIGNKLEYFIEPSGSEFRIGVAGYSDKDEIRAASLIDGKKKVTLLLEGATPTRSIGYLTGSFYDIYNGIGVEKSKESWLEYDKARSYYNKINLHNSLALAYEEGIVLSNLIELRSFDLTYKNIRTKSKFTMGIPKLSKKINDKGELETIYGNPVFEKSKSSGSKYNISFYDINLHNPKFISLLQESGIGGISSEESWNKVARTILYLGKEEIIPYTDLVDSIEERKKMEDEIYERYTILPISITDRTKSLAYEISEGLFNDYDKLRAIELYLNEYEYSFDMGNMNEVTDMVDYFLFEHKQGYCSFYASSMLVLARCLNIPTRYVEGFVIDYSNSKENKNLSYEVTNQDAHAWVEGYFKGIGWIPFEPTAKYHEARYSGWVNYRQEENEATLVNQDKMEELIEEETLEYNPILDGGGYEEDMEESKLSLEEMEKMEDDKLSNYMEKVMVFLGLFLILSVLSCTLIYLLLDRKYKRSYEKKELSSRVTLNMKELLWYVYLDGNPKFMNETLLEYVKLHENGIYEYKRLNYAIQLFMKVRYGGQEICLEEIRELELYVIDYKKYIKEKLGFFSYTRSRLFFIISAKDSE